MKMLKIGVLGGIGPEATGLFYLKLIRRLQDERLIMSNADFPQIVINSIPAPELVYDKITDGDLAPYVRGLKELDLTEPHFIVMVCNTIHLFHDRLQPEIGARILDLRTEVRKKLEESGIRSVTILGTPGTVSRGLYDFQGIKYHNPDREEASLLGRSVFNFNNGIDRQKQVNDVLKVIKKYLAEGSELVVLACTEFAVMCEGLDFPSIDTIDVLVAAVIREFSSFKKLNR